MGEAAFRSMPSAVERRAAADRRRLVTIPVPDFAQTIERSEGAPLTATAAAVLQLNLGRLCNQVCDHCHVEAGPTRREIMSAATADDCLALLAAGRFGTLDLTGGAPEMNPEFRRIVERGTELGRRVSVRSNLTILVAPGFRDLPEFLAERKSAIVASLPCYLDENVDRQRGHDVFRRSIEALRRLNELGYGTSDGVRELTLVFNPPGPKLPPPQAGLESDYRSELRRRYGIEFDRLISITNMPISRFLDSLEASGRTEEYLRALVDAFNPSTVPGLMCRTTLSVDWRGFVHDCDFNQMLGIPTVGAPHVSDLIADRAASLIGRRIATASHCWGCTAGSGSGCGGAIDKAAGRESDL